MLLILAQKKPLSSPSHILAILISSPFLETSYRIINPSTNSFAFQLVSFILFPSCSLYFIPYLSPIIMSWSFTLYPKLTSSQCLHYYSSTMPLLQSPNSLSVFFHSHSFYSSWSDRIKINLLSHLHLFYGSFSL